jgi:hypothetical protein
MDRDPFGQDSLHIFAPSGEFFYLNENIPGSINDARSKPFGANFLEKVNIAGKPALEYHTHSSIYDTRNNSDPLNGLPYRHFSIRDVNGLRSLEVGFFETENSKIIFNKILSTLKFTDIASFQDWKTFLQKNTFSFKYPKGWVLLGNDGLRLQDNRIVFMHFALQGNEKEYWDMFYEKGSRKINVYGSQAVETHGSYGLLGSMYYVKVLVQLNHRYLTFQTSSFLSTEKSKKDMELELNEMMSTLKYFD